MLPVETEMKKPNIAAATLVLLVSCATAAFASPVILYSEPHQGTFIIRDYLLSQAFIESDKACRFYSELQDEADKVARKTGKKSVKNEMGWPFAEARHWLGECLASDKAAKQQLKLVLGATAIARLENVAAFDDMVYIQIEPQDDEQYVDLFDSRSNIRQTH